MIKIDNQKSQRALGSKEDAKDRSNLEYTAPPAQRFKFAHLQLRYRNIRGEMRMDLEKLLAFNQFAMDKTEEEKIALAKQLNVDYEEYKRRIVGKEKEADFIAIMKSLEVLKHFEAYDEGLSHITGEYTPDFKIEMNDGYKMLLEVKHTSKDAYKISQGNLQKRIDFANRQGLPLRFAISLNGVWGLFTTETLQAQKGKLMLNDFRGEKSKSWLDVEFATCSYMFPKQVKIRSIYSTSHAKGMGIWFEPYGQLISFELYYDGKKIFRVKGKNSPYFTHSIYLEALHDRVANTNREINRDGNFTIITEYSDKDIPHTISEYEFLLSPINHMCKEANEKQIRYNSQLAISEKDFSFLSVQILRVVLSQLVNLGMEIIVFRNDKGYSFKDYAAHFWHNR